MTEPIAPRVYTYRGRISATDPADGAALEEPPVWVSISVEHPLTPDEVRAWVTARVRRLTKPPRDDGYPENDFEADRLAAVAEHPDWLRVDPVEDVS